MEVKKPFQKLFIGWDFENVLSRAFAVISIHQSALDPPNASFFFVLFDFYLQSDGNGLTYRVFLTLPFFFTLTPIITPNLVFSSTCVMDTT
jgi:hypothetical protein